jgi:predicted metalloprotease
MQWFGKGSNNVEDGRSGGGGKTILGGGVGIIIVVLGLIFGKDLTGLVGQIPATTGTEEVKQGVPANDPQAQFVAGVLESTEQVWDKEFQAMGKQYEYPKLRLFRDGVQTACGNAGANVGPFYCPGDHKVYIDLSFYDDLKNRFGAAGDFAQAYVIAHEVGHHVQNLLGISEKLDQARGQVSELDEGDIEEALTAANAIGDDKLQKQATGEVQPDSFTHGTSAQRMYWFKKGFETGDIKQGDTFNSNNL